MRTIESALTAAEISANQVDLVAITSTQDIELIIDDPERFSVSFTRHTGHSRDSPLEDWINRSGKSIEEILTAPFLDTFYDPTWLGTLRHRSYCHFFPEHKSRSKESFTVIPWLNRFIHRPNWCRALTLDGLYRLESGELEFSQSSRNELHYPVTVSLDECDIPGYFVSHHAAHGASSFYNSSCNSAIVLTHDGYGVGADEQTGIIFWGDGSALYPILPHQLAVGHLYEMVASEMGLGDYGGAGKLMGLASYGKPRFFERRFIGNYVDWIERSVGFFDYWKFLGVEGSRRGYNVSSLGDPAAVTHRFQVDVAASTQKLFEETMLAAVELAWTIQRRLGLDTKNLCLSGGCALNCPTNERISNESAFSNIFIEPHCDDSGLSIGAALYTYYNICDLPRTVAPDFECNPYLGLAYPVDDIMSEIAQIKDQIVWEECGNLGERAALDLQRNLIVGWFQGRSEIGPRALGSRSILANPCDEGNWPRLNQIKSREQWRPFAPAVLEEEYKNFFLSSKDKSPHMLFNGLVKSDQLPAITHVDLSSRVQTVSSVNQPFYSLLAAFYKLSAVPVVVNTSFNGPGEPIVESPRDALAFFMKSELDVLYLDRFRVVKLIK
jgi:carbamoyltransferase